MSDEFMGDKLFSGKLAVIVTGASQGFGKCISQSFAKRVSKTEAECHFILMARNGEALYQLKKTIENELEEAVVHVITCNFSRPEFVDIFNSSLQEQFLEHEFDKAFLFNNVGSLGNVSIPTTEHQDFDELQDFIMLNLSSCFLITSLAAIIPLKQWGLYCAVKAARKIFFETIALESSKCRVLSYQPGPMPTRMYRNLENSDDAVTKEHLKNFNKYLDSAQKSANILMGVLLDDTFISGKSYDILDFKKSCY